MSTRIEWASQTDVGRLRQRNEDAHAGKVWYEQNDSGAARGLFVLCDGMGGHSGGREASHLAVQIVSERLAPLLAAGDAMHRDISHEISNAVLAANQALFERNAGSGAKGRERAGTTIVALVVANNRIWLIHVGDSRAYQITVKAIRLLTQDHNVGNREIRRGVAEHEAWERVDAEQLTQALGPAPNENVHPDLLCTTVEESTVFLLCSDGVSDNDFVERAGADTLRATLDPESDLTKACETFINSANNANGHDNLTAILVRVTSARTGAESSDAGTAHQVVRQSLLARIGGLFSRRES